MSVIKQSYKTVSLFDRFRLDITTKMKCHTDGLPGKRVLFISDPKKTFTISFEEGMQMLDMLGEVKDNAPTVSYQCCKAGKYIQQRRNDSASDRCAFFHIEVEDDDGKTLHIPGQMVVSDDYKWSDGVEPVLMNLLEGITVC